MSSDAAPNDEVEPVGWDAIDHELGRLYGDRAAKRFGPILPMMLGGRDPLQGISVYKNLSPEPHYHFVTYGFSELYAKETNDPEVSGFGFELTFRLACSAEDPDEPPMWPLNLLQNIARYVFKTGNAFDEWHHMTLNGPIAIGQETDITAIMLVLDPELREIDTPHGHVKFLQVVGLSGDEYGLVQKGYFDQVASRVCSLAPLSITNIVRPSILRDESTRQAITSAEPGLPQRDVFGTIVEWSENSGRLEIRIGATIIPQLKQMLRRLLIKRESIAAYGNQTGVVFELGDRVGWRVEEPLLIVSINSDLVAFFENRLQPIRGEYREHESDAVKFSVVPVEIRDAQGNVIRTVG